jgi:4-hydroxybenzoate polyprenyltransferase
MNAENISGAIAVIVVLGVFVLLALSQAVPNELWTGFGLVLGFFFGNTAGNARAQLKAR